ncbi:MAG: hypothetical protein KDD77_11630, partial [Caldilineaceae bacterium]|nr:hypothetical protein [Caldilineaceae bacterium]
REYIFMTEAKIEQSKAMMDYPARTIDRLAHNWPRPPRRSTCLSSPAPYRAKNAHARRYNRQGLDSDRQVRRAARRTLTLD